jgi:hypothetical protein
MSILSSFWVVCTLVNAPKSLTESLLARLAEQGTLSFYNLINLYSAKDPLQRPAGHAFKTTLDYSVISGKMTCGCWEGHECLLRNPHPHSKTAVQSTA